MHAERPINDTYWVSLGRFMAGAYPGPLYGEDAGPKLRWLLEAGVTNFVDLTKDGELEPYSTALVDEAAQLGLAADYTRWPIPDMTSPEAGTMVEVLNAIDTAEQHDMVQDRTE